MGPDGVALDSKECYRREFPVVGVYRASAVDLLVAVERAVEHPCYSDDVLLLGGDEAAAVAAPVADYVPVEAVDVHQ